MMMGVEPADGGHAFAEEPGGLLAPEVGRRHDACGDELELLGVEPQPAGFLFALGDIEHGSFDAQAEIDNGLVIAGVGAVSASLFALVRGAPHEHVAALGKAVPVLGASAAALEGDQAQMLLHFHFGVSGGDGRAFEHGLQAGSLGLLSAGLDELDIHVGPLRRCNLQGCK